MTPLEKRKLEAYKQKIGELTIDDALMLAIEAEEHKIACGPFDPAFSYMFNQQRMFEEYALLLE